jgi:hypothetical protein
MSDPERPPAGTPPGRTPLPSVPSQRSPTAHRGHTARIQHDAGAQAQRPQGQQLYQGRHDRRDDPRRSPQLHGREPKDQLHRAAAQQVADGGASGTQSCPAVPVSTFKDPVISISRGLVNCRHRPGSCRAAPRGSPKATSATEPRSRTGRRHRPRPERSLTGPVPCLGSLRETPVAIARKALPIRPPAASGAGRTRLA